MLRDHVRREHRGGLSAAMAQAPLLEDGPRRHEIAQSPATPAPTHPLTPATARAATLGRRRCSLFGGLSPRASEPTVNLPRRFVASRVYGVLRSLQTIRITSATFPSVEVAGSIPVSRSNSQSGQDGISEPSSHMAPALQPAATVAVSGLARERVTDLQVAGPLVWLKCSGPGCAWLPL